MTDKAKLIVDGMREGNFTHLADFIASLSAELKRVKHERDAAIADMKDIADNYAVCMHCKKCDDESGACDKWHDKDGCWEWRGVQKPKEKSPE